MTPDWTLFDVGIVIGLFGLVVLVGGITYGLATLIKCLWGILRREVEYRYHFRAVNNPRRNAKIRRGEREPMWDALLWAFGVRR